MTITFTSARRTPFGLEDALQVAFYYTLDSDPRPRTIYLATLGAEDQPPAILNVMEAKLFGAAIRLIITLYHAEHLLPDETYEYWDGVDFNLDEAPPTNYLNYQLELH